MSFGIANGAIYFVRKPLNMKVSVPNIINCSRLLSAFRALPGNADKGVDDLYRFLTIPSGERDAFLKRNVRCSFQYQNNITTPVYDPS